MKNKLAAISVACLVIVVAMCVFFTWLFRPTVMPVRQVSVQGAPAHYQAQVKQAVSPLVHTSLLSVNLHELVVQLEQMPWVAAVTVNRVWPDTLQVELRTQRMVAVWNQQYLLNNYAEKFPLTLSLGNQKNLPVFFGPQGKAVEVMDFYQQFENALKPIHLSIKEIKLGKGNDWQIILNNGIKVQLGQQEMLKRLTRFVDVYNKVFASSRRKAEEVSLQYPNGMAVRWRTR